MSVRTIKESPGAESPEFLWIDLTRACPAGVHALPQRLRAGSQPRQHEHT